MSNVRIVFVFFSFRIAGIPVIEFFPLEAGAALNKNLVKRIYAEVVRSPVGSIEKNSLKQDATR